MNRQNQQVEAKKLLQLMREMPPREPGNKLRPTDELRILAERAIREGDPLKLLAKLDVVREDKEVGTNSGIVINIGAPGSPIRLPDLAIAPSERESAQSSRA
jgi:hypothetical protein